MLHDDPPLESSPPTCAPSPSLDCSSPNYCLLVVRHPEDLASSPFTTKERRRRAEGRGGERYGSATDKLAGYPTDSSITHGAERREDAARRRAGERMASTRGTGMSCSSLPPSLRPSVSPSVRRHYGGGSVLLITQIEVNCGLHRNYAPPPCLAWLWNIA